MTAAEKIADRILSRFVDYEFNKPRYERERSMIIDAITLHAREQEDKYNLGYGDGWRDATSQAIKEVKHRNK